jgi:hypothetical protein
MKRPEILNFINEENLIDEYEFEEALEEYQRQCEYCKED